MENKLTDVLEYWIQGRINTCVMGMLDRIERLERERENADMVIREQARTIDQLRSQIQNIEDRMIEATPDERLSGFAERVYECFDSQEFRDEVQSRIEDFMENDANRPVSYEGLEAWLEDQRFTLKVR